MLKVTSELDFCPICTFSYKLQNMKTLLIRNFNDGYENLNKLASIMGAFFGVCVSIYEIETFTQGDYYKTDVRACAFVYFICVCDITECFLPCKTHM